MLCDVEPYAQERVRDIRDDAHQVTKKLWKEEALGSEELLQKRDLIPLPAVKVAGDDQSELKVRELLRDAQRRDDFGRATVAQLGAILDPASARRKRSRADIKEAPIEAPVDSPEDEEEDGELLKDDDDPPSLAAFHAHRGISRAEVADWRLCPTDGVLEYRLIFPGGSLVRWVPYIPAVNCVIASAAM